MPKQFGSHFGDAEDATSITIASAMQGLMALFGLAAVVLAVLGFWKAPGRYGWSVVLSVVGVPWVFLGVFGRRLARDGNYARYRHWMWLGMALGVLVLIGAGIAAIVITS